MKQSISRVLFYAIIYLRFRLPGILSDLPESQVKRAASSLLFGLSPDGVYPAIPVTRDAVSSYLAFSPLSRRFGTVYFLWHFPSSHEDWVLPSVLPCGVRTFLIRLWRTRLLELLQSLICTAVIFPYKYSSADLTLNYTVHFSYFHLLLRGNCIEASTTSVSRYRCNSKAVFIILMYSIVIN